MLLGPIASSFFAKAVSSISFRWGAFGIVSSASGSSPVGCVLFPNDLSVSVFAVMLKVGSFKRSLRRTPGGIVSEEGAWVGWGYFYFVFFCFFWYKRGCPWAGRRRRKEGYS